jgi:hypothetical protein
MIPEKGGAATAMYVQEHPGRLLALSEGALGVTWNVLKFFFKDVTSDRVDQDLLDLLSSMTKQQIADALEGARSGGEYTFQLMTVVIAENEETDQNLNVLGVLLIAGAQLAAWRELDPSLGIAKAGICSGYCRTKSGEVVTPSVTEGITRTLRTLAIAP